VLFACNALCILDTVGGLYPVFRLLRRYMMKIVFKIFVFVLFGALGVIGFAYSGLYDIAASSPHGGFTSWLLSTTSDASIERRADDVSVPNLDDDKLILAGINDFDSMCIDCHGAPGKKPAALGQGLNPPAPDLAEEAAEMTPAELFWVTKHGIKMTGMPAWGATHDDDALWPVVAFMIRLPDLDADGYQALLARAEGQGHHQADGQGVGDSAGHEHGERDASAAASHEQGEIAPGAPTNDETPDKAAHDHSGHSHDEPTPEKEENPHADGDDHER